MKNYDNKIKEIKIKEKKDKINELRKSISKLEKEIRDLQQSKTYEKDYQKKQYDIDYFNSIFN